MTGVSVVVPSKGGEYLKYLLPALGRQTVKPDEVVLVLKDCDVGRVERLCSSLGIPSVVIEQREGYVTRAYEIGTKAAKGDIVIYTDDDVVPPDRWVQNYSKLHRAYCYASCISSRDIYWDFKLMIERPRMISPYLKPHWWVRQLFLEPPHPLLKKYRFGLYLTKDLRVAGGPYVPSKACHSMPYKGANMSFKKEALDLVRFPEHPKIRRGFGCEQHISLQLILKGLDCVYVPGNPVLHIVRESLSRTSDPRVQEALNREFEAMRSLYADLIKASGATLNISELIRPLWKKLRLRN